MKTPAHAAQAPLVSIVIVCYNYGKYLPDAIRSAKSQTFRNLEIIVVDGGSDDPHTIDVIENLKDPEVKVYRREHRCLVGDNRNFGIDLTQGKYVCCLDADDMIRPSYIEKAVILLEALGVDIVSASRSEFGEGGKVSLLKFRPTLEDVLNENQMNTVSVFTRAIWQKAGGFDDFGLGEHHIHEDWNFWMKCMTAGARVHNLPYEALFRYRVHEQASLSQQSGQVPKLDVQTEFIRKEHRRLVEKGLEDRAAGSREIAVNSDMLEGLATHSTPEDLTSLMILVPCFDLATLGWMEPWVKTLSGGYENVVLIATKDFEDREDRLGLWLDRISPHHYDYDRSFSCIDKADFVSYLIRSKKVRELYIMDDAWTPEGLSSFSLNIRNFSSQLIESRFRPLKEGPEGKLLKLRIVSEGEHNPQSAGSEVWLLSIRNPDGYIIHSDLFSNMCPPGWTVVNCEASPLGKALLATGKVSCELEVPEGSTLQFLRHDWSGRVSLDLSDRKKPLDLYSKTSTTEIITL